MQKMITEKCMPMLHDTFTCITVLLLVSSIVNSQAPPTVQPGDVESLKNTPACHACCVKGRKGIRGLMGHPGVEGQPGYEGIEGTNGLEGIHGPQGSRGQKGDAGDIGEKGTIGDIGPRGPGVGEKGEKGLPGDKGYIGFTGIKGPPGPIGSSAFAGDEGQKGQKGSAEQPTRVFFSARQNSRQTYGPINNLIVTYNILHRNEGSDMNKDTGKFKAPTNGLYFFAATVFKTQTITNFQVYMRAGGANIAEMVGTTNDNDDSCSATVVVRLSKNDEVYLLVQTGTIKSTNILKEALFCGYLIV
ncbi:uncharacterized protein [Antedon mediterranea]|uniref:uncharacterized protein isoform X1 n=1 Tax=Antedon mediterranea TaxID=105859 RepID=UPI003AF9CDA1